MKEKQYAWSWYEDGDYSIKLESIEECFSEARLDGLITGETIWIGETQDIEVYADFDPDWIIEELITNLDFDFDVEPEAVVQLKEKGQKLVDDWIEEFGVGKGYFYVVNVKEYVIPEVTNGTK